ncbi:TetR/AcrR family transcriptional regulator [Propionibacterium sp. NM47_B9-13]|uniref:TetR/AcrR family transcriptional regulator n=1 Tax=Cutibacterium modestum TaxID=2559073 RepID=UPI0001EF221B|nr:TetR family transcriptional regulator [Cutibacterium modestum]TGY29270.1 TetR/AcrR family transcriptional regulator [Propionibacterium sp. NM47_B9-13]AOH46598.1 TetR family transcriptional regulator [Cutibacterium modestum]EFS75473.1 transcriptional regulator, TetR family [Cutibacterium modestum HL037PA2]EFT16793.1 transcriptional regulator, TetR family [Cutibacterium modestum HL037PA3]REB75523.1 TetR/AcrR family transcriptional regulator [Cutibacterium modestum]
MTAARSLFLAGDFQSVSLRAIAREAGVDTSLVSYYFGSKQSLYNEAMSLPNGPHRIIAEVCSRTDPNHLGDALVKAFIDAWDGHLGLGGPDPQMQGVVQALLTQPDAFDMLRRFYTEEILAPVVELLVPRFGVAEAGVRASLGLSQLLGIFTARYVVGLQSLADLPATELIAREGPALQSTLTGPTADG